MTYDVVCHIRRRVVPTILLNHDHDIVLVHLESCTPGTWQYKVVCTGTSQYVLFWIQGGTRKVKIVTVHTSTDWYVQSCTDLSYFYGSTYWYVLVCTSMYKEVQGGTTKYKEVHGGSRNSTRRYKKVCTASGTLGHVISQFWL